jgi:hypothetical protein
MYSSFVADSLLVARLGLAVRQRLCFEPVRNSLAKPLSSCPSSIWPTDCLLLVRVDDVFLRSLLSFTNKLLPAVIAGSHTRMRTL